MRTDDALDVDLSFIDCLPLITRIHNVYLIASAWRLIQETLLKFQREGLNNSTIRTELKLKPQLRSQFLVLYDTVNVLSHMYQARFALIATTTGL